MDRPIIDHERWTVESILLAFACIKGKEDTHWVYLDHTPEWWETLGIIWRN